MPDALGDLLDTLWIDRDGELIISGTLPLFADEPVDLSVELPPIVPPDGDAAAGTFREGRLSFGLSTNPDSGQTEISLVGQVDLYLPDTCLTDDPNDPASRCSVRMTGADGTSSDFDAVTFQVDATVTLPVNPTDDGSVVLGGGLAPGSVWEAPFGTEWLDLNAFRIEVGVLFGPSGGGFTFGVRASATIGANPATAPTCLLYTSDAADE